MASGSAVEELIWRFCSPFAALKNHIRLHAKEEKTGRAPRAR